MTEEKFLAQFLIIFLITVAVFCLLTAITPGEVRADDIVIDEVTYSPDPVVVGDTLYFTVTLYNNTSANNRELSEIELYDHDTGDLLAAFSFDLINLPPGVMVTIPDDVSIDELAWEVEAGIDTLEILLPEHQSSGYIISVTACEPISIKEEQILDFGTFTAGDGIVTVDPEDGSVGMTFTGYHDGGHPAQFDVSGQGNTNYYIDLPGDGQISYNGSIMSISNFVSDKTDERGTLDSVGLDTFYIGATLSVDSEQAPGTYSAFYPVTVGYE